MDATREFDFSAPESPSEQPLRARECSPRAGLSAPLAARMRPSSLAEVVGHRHILGEGCLLPRLVAADNFGSLIFYGPPGCGKTTLAEVIARQTRSRFVKINAVLSNAAGLRDELAMARYRRGERTIVFIDEIHRFNKAQQDLLLPDVEDGNIRLIGATTQNPGLYINAPLLSRSHLFRLEALSEADIASVLRRALEDCSRGLGNFNCLASDDILLGIARVCGGDLRRALNALETMVLAAGGNSSLSEEDLKAFARERRIRYDADGDEHYDTISAFIKSVRGCDPDAAMFWLAKMLRGGEDPRFIARRLVILASEDVGMADPRALPLASAAFDAVERVGMPECALNLAHATIFLAAAPKSNSATLALERAYAAADAAPSLAVPAHLRDAHSAFNKKIGNGAEYIYSHDCPGHISGQDYAPLPLDIYRPTNYGAEAAAAERLAFYKKIKSQLQQEQKSKLKDEHKKQSKNNE